MDCASSASRSLWNIRRGCSGLGSMPSIGTDRETSCATGAGARVGSSVPSPRPSALRELSGLFMVENLFGEFDIAFGAARSRIVSQNRLPEARRFRQPNAPRNHGFEDLVLEKLFQIIRDLSGQICPIVEHRQQN